MDESEEKQGLNRRQRAAIPYLVTAKSLQDGCEAAGISTSTLYVWLKDDAFRDELEGARSRVIEESLRRLKAGISGAVDGLIELSDDKNKLIRIRACEKIIDFFLKVRELDEIERRLESIERIVLERKVFR